MSFPAVMFQGTGSDVGKSLIVAGIGRALANRGLRVLPFKPQNRSNNAAVTAEGGEIGRAQALQARACRVAPHTDMNPVLLKPQTDVGAQVVVQGKMRGTWQAGGYHRFKPDLMPAVLESFQRLARSADMVLVEGAGSPAEINLRAGDIANMGFAMAARVPVVLIGDIDRGGVIASIVGTMHLLPPDEVELVKGFLINKFRGDPALFSGGIDLLESHTGLSSLGVVPFLPDAAYLPSEDGVVLERARVMDTRAVKIIVPMVSRIANFDDLDPLAAEPDVAVEFVPPGRPLPLDADVIVLPGTKSTVGDLAFLRAQGWDIDIRAFVRQGGRVLGICGGYQMLGRAVRDPHGVEGPAGEAAGLGLLDVDTEITAEKRLVEVAGNELSTGCTIAGYEMHVGQTRGPDCGRPMLRLGHGADGAVSTDGRVRGCYVHGLFAHDAFRHAWLRQFHERRASGISYHDTVDTALDGIAAALERHLDMQRLLDIAAGRGR